MLEHVITTIPLVGISSSLSTWGYAATQAVQHGTPPGKHPPSFPAPVAPGRRASPGSSRSVVPICWCYKTPRPWISWIYPFFLGGMVMLNGFLCPRFRWIGADLVQSALQQLWVTWWTRKRGCQRLSMSKDLLATGWASGWASAKIQEDLMFFHHPPPSLSLSLYLSLSLNINININE